MTYRVTIRPKALKFIEKQDKNQRLRIYKAIYNLPEGDIKRLTGRKNEYRLRVRKLQNYLWIKSKWAYYFNNQSRQQRTSVQKINSNQILFNTESKSIIL